MKVLPSALEAFNGYKSFLLWKLVYNQSKNKNDKLPASPLTGEIIGNDAVAHYVTADEAIVAADKYSMGVAFVFTENTPFWFLDIDNCLVDNEWSTLAKNLCALLPGAAVEVSQSGRGLHIFGRGDAPDHSCKNIALGLEFYTEGRFVALTGDNAVGDANTDHTDAIKTLVDEYFPPQNINEIIDWTNKPNTLYRGPEDDDELIKKMFSASSLKNVFGNDQCKLSDLWNANADVLAKKYPAVGDIDSPYDKSSADAALCMQLAWWTGGDCERIERLFNRSELVRDKWQNRPQYRRDTILNAVQRCVGCLGEDTARRELARLPWKPDAPSQSLLTKVTILSGPRVIPFEERPNFFDNHYFIRSLGKVFCPDGVLRSSNDYTSCYGNYEFLEQFSSEKPIRDPWKAYVLAPDVKRLEADALCYSPGHKYLSIVNKYHKHFLNTYEHFDIERVPGDVTPFLDHINKLLPEQHDRNVLIGWLAAFLQYPGVKFRYALFIQGAEGCGKSIFGTIVAACIGHQHVYLVNSDEFAKGAAFNKWAGCTRLGMIDEFSCDRKTADATLKRYIDQDRIEIQIKGVDQVTADNCVNFIITSNFKDSLPINESSRRYAPLFCKQQTVDQIVSDGMGGAYFPNLLKWLADGGYSYVYDYLMNYAIPEELNPTKGAHRAPQTSSFKEAVTQSMSIFDASMGEVIKSSEPGTRNGWFSVQAIRLILEQDGIKLKSTIQIAKYLQKQGYVTHPALENNHGRTSQILVQEGGVRVKLYLSRNHEALTECETPLSVYESYKHAQGYITPPAGVIPK